MKPEGYREPILREESVETKIPRVVLIGRHHIVRILKDEGIDIPPDASISFRVPSGGDYSGCDVELDDKQQVISVRYSR